VIGWRDLALNECCDILVLHRDVARVSLRS